MIKARFIIEAQGRSKNIVETAMKKLIEKIKSIKGVEVFDEHWEPTEEIDKGIFSALVDLGIEFENAEVFFATLLLSGPSSVIILEPEEIKITMGEFQNIVNDIVNMMHAFAQANLELRVKLAQANKKALQ